MSNCMYHEDRDGIYGLCALGLHGGLPSKGVCSTCNVRKEVSDPERYRVLLRNELTAEQEQDLRVFAHTITDTVYVVDTTKQEWIEFRLKNAEPAQRSIDFIAASKALIAGRAVSKEMKALRIAICADCEYLKRDGISAFCGLCGCCVSTTSKLFNLTAIKENLPSWGCKHPSRPVKGWPYAQEITNDSEGTTS